jgi:hypothetical protein
VGLNSLVFRVKGLGFGVLGLGSGAWYWAFDGEVATDTELRWFSRPSSTLKFT